MCRVASVSYLNTKVPAVPWPSTSNGAKEILPTCNSSPLPPEQRGEHWTEQKWIRLLSTAAPVLPCGLQHVTCCTFGPTGDVSICVWGAAAVTAGPWGKVCRRKLGVWERERDYVPRACRDFSAVNFVGGINNAFGIHRVCEKCCLNRTLAF